MDNENREPAEPLREEVRLLLELLDDEIFQSRRSRRSIERELGMGQGYLGSLLNGRINLKVGHVWKLGLALGIEPLLLFYRAAPREHQAMFLSRLGIPLKDGDDPERPCVPMTKEEIVQMVKDCLSDEFSDGNWARAYRQRWGILKD